MARRSSRASQPQQVSIQVRFEGGEDLPILFANHIFVRTGPDGCLVSFAQSHGPYVTEISAEDLERGGVAAKIIARLLVPHNRIREFAGILNGVVDLLEGGAKESTNDN